MVARASGGRAARRSVAAGVLLLAVYAGLSLLHSPRGFLGTDTGGKVATLEVMAERGRFDPDLGYWAEAWDPGGRLHPIAFTSHTASGKWVNVTTLPALWVGWQLYSVGGNRLALLVPMLGSVAAAFAGLALLRRLRTEDRWAWAGFWLLGLASPLTIYALDFWEHSLGVALMAWAVVLLVDGGRRRALAAGLLLGSAATMRTEALVYLAVAVAVVVAGASAGASGASRFRERSGPLRGPDRSRIGAAALLGLVILAGAVVPLVANEVVERRVVGSTIRASRVAGTATAIADEAGSRAAEAAVTLVGLEATTGGLVLGAVMVALLVFAVRRRDGGAAVVAAAGAGLLVLVRFAAGGLGFVPGLGPAWVLPAAASVLPSRRGRFDLPTASRPAAGRLLSWIALGAVPLVLATQFRGGAGPQWAGRYLLASGFLLAVLGWWALASRPRAVAASFATLAVAVTGCGLAWTTARTHGVARAVSAIEDRSESVVVSGVFHLAREGGATYGRKRWLTMTPTAGPDHVVDVLEAAGVERFAAVELVGERPVRFAGFRRLDTGTMELFDDVHLRVSTWRREP